MTKAISLAMMLFFGINTTTLPIDTQFSNNSPKSYVVVIDAGHGGKDPGAVSGGVQEKDLNLDIAKRLDELLKNEGIKTYMTRTDDTFIDLYDRSGLANLAQADLLVSIHNNAGTSKTSGTMSLYYPAADGKGKEAASIFQQELLSALGTKNMGIIARPNLAVLRTTHMPAVLEEVGYLTNKEELNKLKTGDYRQKAAEALKEGVLKSLKAIAD